MGKPNRYSSEVRERAVRMVLNHEREYDSRCHMILAKQHHLPLERYTGYIQATEIGARRQLAR